MGNVIFATENYFDDTRANSIEVSSENATYPISNAYRFKRRGRTFRTKGNVVIEAGVNDGIRFTDDVSTFTATIAAGSYLWGTTFLTAIKAALDDASTNTFTVTITAANKINISSNGTTFSLLLTNVLFTAYDVLGFSNSADLTGSTNYTADFSRIHTEEWIKVDLGVPLNPKAFIVIGKRNSPLVVSESATLTLQGNTFDNFTSPEYEQTITWHENVLSLINMDGLHDNALRYWRFLIEDPENSAGYIEISNLFLGDSFIPEQGSVQFSLDNNLQDLSTTVFSESGVALTDVRPQTQEFDLDFRFLNRDDQEELQYIFEVHGTAKPFFIIMDPCEFILNSPQDFIKYVRFVDAPTISLFRPNIFNTRLKIREEL